MKRTGCYWGMILLGCFALGGCLAAYPPQGPIWVHAGSGHSGRPGYPLLPDSTAFVIVPRESYVSIDGVKVGRVVYDNGGNASFGSSWAHDRIIDNLRDSALLHGANLVRVTHYQGPTQRSQGYTTADLYLVSDVQRYNFDNVVDWTSHPKLSLDDFKFAGPVVDDPSVGQSRGIYELGTVARFRCKTSWINKASAEALVHEQGIYDLCEIYSRQYRYWILMGHAQKPFYDSVYKAWMAKRSEYEWQTYHGQDRVRQAEWTAKIGDALLMGPGGVDAEFRVLPPP